MLPSFSHSVVTLALFFLLLFSTAFCTACVLSSRKNALCLSSARVPPPAYEPSSQDIPKFSPPGSPGKRVTFGSTKVIPTQMGTDHMPSQGSPDIKVPPTRKAASPQACNHPNTRSFFAPPQRFSSVYHSQIFYQTAFFSTLPHHQYVAAVG